VLCAQVHDLRSDEAGGSALGKQIGRGLFKVRQTEVDDLQRLVGLLHEYQVGVLDIPMHYLHFR